MSQQFDSRSLLLSEEEFAAPAAESESNGAAFEIADLVSTVPNNASVTSDLSPQSELDVRIETYRNEATQLREALAAKEQRIRQLTEMSVRKDEKIATLSEAVVRKDKKLSELSNTAPEKKDSAADDKRALIGSGARRRDDHPHFLQRKHPQHQHKEQSQPHRSKKTKFSSMAGMKDVPAYKMKRRDAEREVKERLSNARCKFKLANDYLRWSGVCGISGLIIIACYQYHHKHESWLPPVLSVFTLCMGLLLTGWKERREAEALLESSKVIGDYVAGLEGSLANLFEREPSTASLPPHESSFSRSSLAEDKLGFSDMPGGGHAGVERRWTSSETVHDG